MRAILEAMLRYAERNRPEAVAEVQRRLMMYQLNQGPPMSILADQEHEIGWCSTCCEWPNPAAAQCMSTIRVLDNELIALARCESEDRIFRMRLPMMTRDEGRYAAGRDLARYIDRIRQGVWRELARIVPLAFVVKK